MWRVALACMVAACVADHTSGALDIKTLDCDSCHDDKFEQATMMITHTTKKTCGDCHRTVDTGKGLADWKPALVEVHNTAGMVVSHPEDKFTISSGPHEGILCADCHDPSINEDSSAGVTMSCTVCNPDNVVCTNCHTGAHAISKMAAAHHVGESDAVAGYDPTQCRLCHQYGRK